MAEVTDITKLLERARARRLKKKELPPVVPTAEDSMAKLSSDCRAEVMNLIGQLTNLIGATSHWDLLKYRCEELNDKKACAEEASAIEEAEEQLAETEEAVASVLFDCGCSRREEEA